MKIKFLLGLFLTISFTAAQAQQAHWSVPDFAVVQYAGSIGYFSAGMGYNVFKSRARLSTHFGMVPESRGGRLNVASVKLFFNPTTLTVWNRVRMNPIDVGLIGSYNYGESFETKWPEGVHPKGYYWWNPALRAHLGIESSVTYEFRKGHSLRAITGYIEYNSNDLYLISFIQNIKTVRLWDIIKLGTGVRIHFNERVRSKK
jgi:hypothetical protein